MLEPNEMKSSDESVEPNFVAPQMLSVDPNRPNARHETDELKLM
jgi:hypothetical protein